jgi:hypothetical protein
MSFRTSYSAVNYLHILITYSVFAKRLGHSQPFWNPFLRRFDWQRFATNTVPRLPDNSEQKFPIPWPEAPKVRIPDGACS